MSPEQSRGKTVDKRTDVWAFGCVLYEMFTGRPVFGGETSSDTLAAVLEREPDWSQLPANIPPAVRRLIERCLRKDPKQRLRDIGDARLELEEALASVVTGGTTADPPANSDSTRSAVSPPRVALWLAIAGAVILAVAGAMVVIWKLRRSGPFPRNPLEAARVTRLTDFAGAEHHAAISRDGRFVVFLSDRDGSWDAWVSQVGTGKVYNLTKGGVRELRNPATRTLGFSPDGSLVALWSRVPASGSVDAGWAVPMMGGRLQHYLKGVSELDWSPDGTRIVYHPPAEGDPLFVTASNEKVGHQIYVARPGFHNHFPVWSPDGEFIYFVHGLPLDSNDIWRIRPDGGEPERLTFHDARVSFPTLINDSTLLYLATDSDGRGPWIYLLDANRRTPRRISTGLEQYTSLAASVDGRRLVATVSTSIEQLWRVPIADGVVDESRASPISLPTASGLSPRAGPEYIVYRALGSGNDALWKVAAEGPATELWTGIDGRAIAGPAIAPDGQRLAFAAQSRERTSSM